MISSPASNRSRSPATELADDCFEFILRDIAITALVEIGEANPRRLLEGLQLGAFASIAGLDEPQPLAQYFAGVLEAAGPDQIGDDFLMLLGEHDITRRHIPYPCTW